MGYYIDSQGNYYEGDRVRILDKEVPRRPDSTYDWVGGKWLQDPIKAKELHNGSILVQIQDLESLQHRHVRDIALGKGNVITGGFTPVQRLENLENQIATLRAQLQ